MTNLERIAALSGRTTQEVSAVLRAFEAVATDCEMTLSDAVVSDGEDQEGCSVLPWLEQQFPL